MTRVCVFCGSSTGARAEYVDAARGLATALLHRRLELVYGGGSVGLMGAVADAVLAGGGQVTGVIPRGLARRELAHGGVTTLHVVDSMHERKALMASLVDAFVALPGGLGTLEEMLEALTWSQLGIHRKPVGVLNVAGYYDGLRAMLAHAVREGFVRPQYLSLIVFDDTPDRLLDALAAWTPPEGPVAWLTPSQI